MRTGRGAAEAVQAAGERLGGQREFGPCGLEELCVVGERPRLAECLLAGRVHAPRQPGVQLRGRLAAVGGAGVEIVQQPRIGVEAGQFDGGQDAEEQANGVGPVRAARATAEAVTGPRRVRSARLLSSGTAE